MYKSLRCRYRPKKLARFLAVLSAKLLPLLLHEVQFPVQLRWNRPLLTPQEIAKPTMPPKVKSKLKAEEKIRGGARPKKYYFSTNIITLG